MMLDRYAIERLALERQAERVREADESREAPRAPVARRAVGDGKARRRWAMEATSWRRRVARLVGVAAAAEAVGGGGGGAIGYEP